MKTSQSIINIAPALLKAQKEIGSAKKGSVNPFFHSNYASLGDVMEACKDILNENGITVLQPIGTLENGVYVETVLLHESGEWISDAMKIAPKSETNPQDQGSAISYARRYSLQSMVFIPAEDDDAEKATSRPVQVSQQAPAKTVYATSKQVGMIASLLTKKGQRDEDLKFKYQVKSKNDLTLAQASQIIENLLKLPDVEDVLEVDINDIPDTLGDKLANA